MGFFLLLYYTMLTEALGLTHSSWTNLPWLVLLGSCEQPMHLLQHHHLLPQASGGRLGSPKHPNKIYTRVHHGTASCPVLALRCSACPRLSPVPSRHHLWSIGILWLVGPFSITKFMLRKANSRGSPMWEPCCYQKAAIPGRYYCVPA